MQDLVEYMVRPLVAHPDDVQVSVVEGEASLLLELRVNAADYARFRGPQGHLRAMQAVVAVAGGPRKPVLDLVDDQDADEDEE